jgi:methylglutaconyl-CoA hydratase
MSDRLLLDVTDGVMTIRLNRPDKRNAMDSEMVGALHAALDQADLDAKVSALLLRGEGPDFCAGADLAELLDSADQSPAQNARDAQNLGNVFIRMRDLPKPIVAAVHGRALAGGCGLATAADIVVAASDATLGYPEIKRGFVPAMVMAMLVRAVGEPVAFDLMATGRTLYAAEAKSLGLIARVVDGDVFLPAEELARMLANSSGTALGLLKKELYSLDQHDFPSAIRLGANVNAVARATPDFHSAVAGFLNKNRGAGS